MTDAELDKLKHEISAPYIMSALGLVLTKRNGEYVARCPFHEEKTPSFTVRIADGVWQYYCFGCQAKGNLFQFCQNFCKLSFKDAVKKVTDMWEREKDRGAVNKVFQPTLSATKEKRTVPMDKIAQWERNLEYSPEGRKYLESRGITMETAKKLHVGFVQDISSISPNHPQARDGWIVFSYLKGDTARLVKFRSISPDVKKEDRIRSMPNMESCLYNYDSVSVFDDVFLVEGEMDALTLEQAGYRAVSLPNASYVLSPTDREHLLTANMVYLAGDMDVTGRNKMRKLWQELKGRVFLMDWPAKDANASFLAARNVKNGTFKAIVEQAQTKARECPMPNLYDVKSTLLTADTTNPVDDPNRFVWPWRAVDEMAVIRPGQVILLFGSRTGVGKTVFGLAGLVQNAIKGPHVVVNYSAELTPQEYAELLTSHLTGANLNSLVPENFKDAAEVISDARFYVGYDPNTRGIDAVLDLMEKTIREFGATILCIDHIHYLTDNEPDQNIALRRGMQRIVNMAKKYNVIFLVMAQNRKPKEKSGQPASINDAKDSQVLIANSNVVFMLHRDEVKDIDPNNPPRDVLKPETMVKLQKGRRQGVGKAVTFLLFKGEQARFFEMTNEQVGMEEL